MNGKKYKTCTISCMLVVLKYLKKIKGFRFLLKRKYFKELKSEHIDNVLLSRITYFLSEKDIECKLIHSGENIFDENIDKKIKKELSKEYKEYITMSEFKGAYVRNNEDVSLEVIKRHLKGNYFAILPIINNFILLIDFKDNFFMIYDPLKNKKRKITEDELIDSMNVTFDRYCLMIRKNM